jgi:uncharacterized protein (TIGR02453 family)
MTDRAFAAFPKEGLQFLRTLKRNNNRVWFQEHKSIYENSVKQPMLNLIDELAIDFQKFAPEMLASPKVSAYRIYRDTRFSNDKSPYKTYAAAVFPRIGLGKHEGAAFYLHIAPNEVFIGGGLYMPLPEDLNIVRQTIADDAAAFERIIGGRQFCNLFGGINGERLSRVPRGFPADHRAAEYLKYKQFLVGRRLPGSAATSASFYRNVVDTFRTMLPFIRFLNEPIVRARRIRERQDALLRSH